MLLENQHIIELVKDTGWSLKGKTLSKGFKFGNFIQSIDFVNSVASLAEKYNHHPGIEINGDHVRINLTTHDEGGVSDKDLNLATKIDDL